MRYKFPLFEDFIEDPMVEVSTISIDIKNKTCRADLIITKDLNEYGVSLDGFTYKYPFKEEEMFTWIFSELTNYEVD